MTQILTHLYLASATLCALLAAHVLQQQNRKSRGTRLLGLNFGLSALLNLLAFSALEFDWAFAQILRPALALLLGPAVYIYIVYVLKPTARLGFTQLLHATPCVMVFVFMVSESPARAAVDFVITGSFALYAAIAAAHLVRSSGSLETTKRWLWVLVALLALSFIIEFAVLIEIGIARRQPGHSVAATVGAGLYLVFVAAVLLLSLKQAPLLSWMTGPITASAKRAVDLDDTQAHALFNRWDTLVTEKALYKREGGLTLRTAGRIAGVPARHLSQAINRVYGGSFSLYLNDRRIAAAIQLLQEQPHLPLMQVMLEAGFSTKSHFNREFQRVIGFSPSSYRQSL